MSNNVNTQGNVRVPGRLKQTAIDEQGNLLPIAGASDIYDDDNTEWQKFINTDLLQFKKDQEILNEELKNATGVAPSRPTPGPDPDPYADMFNGLEKVYLPKNVKEVTPNDPHNYLSQTMMSKQNAMYIINYDFELETNIVVPANCVLKFEGGSISSHQIKLNGAKIQSDNVAFKNIVIAPEQNMTLRTSWFGLDSTKDCSSTLTMLLSAIANHSTLVIDNDIRIDNIVQSPYMYFSTIKGEARKDLKKVVVNINYQTPIPTGSEISFIELSTECCMVENLAFSYTLGRSKESGIEKDGIVNILEVKANGAEGDSVISNCEFSVAEGNEGSSLLKLWGRGNTVDNCLFLSTKGFIPKIKLIGKWNGETTEDQKPSNADRAIRITNNRLHGNQGYFIWFEQDPTNENTTFVNTLISGNIDDVNSGFIYSNAKHHGLIITNNYLTGSIGNEKQCEFHNTVKGLLFANNSLVYSENDNFYAKYEIQFDAPVSQAHFVNNYIDGNTGSGFVTLTSSAESLIISGNIFGSSCFKIPSGSSGFALLFADISTINNVIIKNNIYNGQSSVKDLENRWGTRTNIIVSDNLGFVVGERQA